MHSIAYFVCLWTFAPGLRIGKKFETELKSIYKVLTNLSALNSIILSRMKKPHAYNLLAISQQFKRFSIV